TAVVEKKSLGGTCLNIGCIPSKALLASSEHYHNATHTFAAHGIIAKDVSVDLPTLMKRKDTVVSTLCKGVGFLLKKNKVDVIEGFGSIKDAHTVSVDNNGKKQDVQADNILLATGSVSVELPFMKLSSRSAYQSRYARRPVPRPHASVRTR
ncbi:MAG: dihydrolipoyl dehydrogenase, partial [Agrobacterium fabrum]